jgi:hypothetical protein
VPITVAPATSKFEKYCKFVKVHERLLIFVGCLVLAFYAYDKGIAYLDRRDARQATAAQQVVNTDAVTNQQLTGQLTQLRAQVALDTAQQVAKIKAAQAAATQHQIIDQTLPLPDLASRWAYLASLQPGDITPTADNKLLLTDAGARATVKQLENIPAMTETIVQTDAELAGCNQVSGKKDDVIAGLNKQIADTAEARKVDAKAAKAAQRKSWLKGFKWGFVGGFISGLFVGHAV